MNALLARAAAALLLSFPVVAAAQQGPIKIGMLLEMTGNFSPNATEALDATRLYFDEIGNTVAGRKIELIVEDTAGKPDLGLTKARKLVESDRVHMLAGIVNTGVALAVSSYIREKKIPLIINADAGANGLTMPGKLLNPFIVRVSQSGRGPGAAAADWAHKNGWRRVSILVSDYAGGLEVAGSFARVFCFRGGQVVQEQYTPLGTADYGPYLNNIDRKVDGWSSSRRAPTACASCASTSRPGSRERSRSWTSTASRPTSPTSRRSAIRDSASSPRCITARPSRRRRTRSS